MCAVSQPVSALVPHPSLERWCLKKSLAANLMAFSGVTSVRFTAAPGRVETKPQRQKNKRQNRKLKPGVRMSFRLFSMVLVHISDALVADMKV